MPYYTRSFPNERIECRNCDVVYSNRSQNKINETWCCPSCGEKLHIFITYGNDKLVIRRYLPTELQSGYSVLLNTTHDVLNVTKNTSQSGKHYKIALAGHGTHHANNNDFLNCVEGSWR